MFRCYSFFSLKNRKEGYSSSTHSTKRSDVCHQTFATKLMRFDTMTQTSSDDVDANTLQCQINSAFRIREKILHTSESTMKFLVSMLLFCSLCEGLLHDTPQRRQVPLAAAELQSTHDEARRAMISNAVGFGVLSLLAPMANAADSKVSTSSTEPFCFVSCQNPFGTGRLNNLVL